MGFRVVKVSSRCKLETQLNYLVCRSDKESRILLDDIAVLLIENQQVCITTALITELINHKIKVIFCDEKHNPSSELVPQHGAYNTYERLMMQMEWSKETKDLIWQNIIYQKISNQAKILHSIGEDKAEEILQGYLKEIEIGDVTNREGLAAKTYFAAMFGSNFDRRKDKDIRNTYLNYGYSMLLSSFNREVSIAGYQCVIGIHHIGSENPFNFGCDLMEPFRPFVDRYIIQKLVNENDYKKEFVNILNSNVSCDENLTILENAVHNYALSVFNALNSKSSEKISKVTFLDEQL